MEYTKLVLLLNSCVFDENTTLGQVIWTIIGWIALIALIEAIFNLIFNFFAIRFPYIYFPI